MKIRTRIATAATAVIAALASVLVGAPAFASSEEGGERIDTLAPFSTAGEPVHVVATVVTVVILLAVVLLLSTWVGNMFEKNKG